MNWQLKSLLIGAVALWGVALAGWLAGAWHAGRARVRWALSAVIGTALVGASLAWLWLTLGRPPMRTLGETRLWYAFLLPLLGLLLEWRLSTRVLPGPMLAFGILFAAIDLAQPQAMDRTLMPALQSVWFVPHVVVYMAAYAALGLAAGVAAWHLVRAWWWKVPVTPKDALAARLLVQLGLPMLTFGLVFGAIWAKEAWGHYWTWDPKETWAFLTWAAYLLVVHYLKHQPTGVRTTLVLILLAFLVVLGCWFLINLLPSAASSVHTYTS